MQERTKKMIVGGFFAFLMVASVIGFAVNFVAPSQNELDYFEHRFTYNPQLNVYDLNLREQDYQFLFFPGDLESIEMPEGAKELFGTPVVAVTYDPESEMKEVMAEAQYYFEQQLSDVLVIDRALTNSSGTKLTEKNCKDATEEQPVVKLSAANESGIKLEDNCLKINAVDDFDLIAQSERVMYSVLGVMP